jgi:hypothetical protein
MPASVAKNAGPHRVPPAKSDLEILERRDELAGEVMARAPQGLNSVSHSDVTKDWCFLRRRCRLSTCDGKWLIHGFVE